MWSAVLEEKEETISEQVKGLSGNSNLPAPFLQSALHQAAHADEAADFHEVDDMDAELLVGETFRRLFPDSFQHVMPIRNHQASYGRPPCRASTPGMTVLHEP